MLIKRMIFLLILFSGLTMIWCGILSAEDAKLPEDVIAVIGDTPITLEDFRKEMVRRGGPGRSFATENEKAALLSDLVRSELIYAAALQSGYDKDTRVIEALKRLMVNSYLKDNLEPRLAGITIGEEEMRAYYDAHLDEFTTPRLIRGAVIKFSVPSKAQEDKKAEIRERAEAALAEAAKLPASTRSFGNVAVKYSDDQATRYRGGDMGLINPENARQKWDGKVLDALIALENPGDLSPVVTAPDGFYILRLMEIEESRTMTFDEVTDTIRYRLSNSRKKDIENGFLEELKKKVEVRTDLRLLEKIEPVESKSPLEPPSLPSQ